MFMVNNLVGFGAVVDTLTTLTYITEDGGISTTVTIPATARSGDLAVLVNASRVPRRPLVTPSGWTNVVNVADSLQRVTVHYKVLTGGDPGAVITGMDGSFAETLQILIFDRMARLRPSRPSTFGAQLTSGDPTLQTVAANGQATPIPVLGGLTDQDTTLRPSPRLPRPSMRRLSRTGRARPSPSAPAIKSTMWAIPRQPFGRYQRYRQPERALVGLPQGGVIDRRNQRARRTVAARGSARRATA
ncbi:MAG: hypothetical protein IPK28_15045 [Devosia sp.]|nr:hypothetical protein [Devosia sp.]